MDIRDLNLSGLESMVEKDKLEEIIKEVENEFNDPIEAKKAIEGYINLNLIFYNFQKIIDVLLKYKREDGICYATAADVARELNREQPGVAKILRKLEKIDNCIEKISLGKYIVHKSDLFENGPHKKYLDFVHAMRTIPDFWKLSLKEKAKLLNMTEKEIYMCWGYYYY